MNPAESVLDQHLTERLATSGLRFTPQRQHVYGVLVGKSDHPTAEEVFMRAKQTMPEISIATVYNCLDALVKCGLVRQVTLDRGATRFCPNMTEHGHFCCTECGEVVDIALTGKGTAFAELPVGYRVQHYEITFRGLCQRCAGTVESAPDF